MSAMLLLTSILCSPDFGRVGLYDGCTIIGRLAYPFFHANVFHAVINVYCLLSIVFLYETSLFRLLVAYLIAVSVPVGMLNSWVGGFCVPSVGLSGVLFVLLGTHSCSVQRKLYYQAYMLSFIMIGFFIKNMNAVLHLYCYVVGVVVSFVERQVRKP